MYWFLSTFSNHHSYQLVQPPVANSRAAFRPADSKLKTKWLINISLAVSNENDAMSKPTLMPTSTHRQCPQIWSTCFFRQAVLAVFESILSLSFRPHSCSCLQDKVHQSPCVINFLVCVCDQFKVPLSTSFNLAFRASFLHPVSILKGDEVDVTLKKTRS